MILRPDASLRDMQQAASLQAWHFQQMLVKAEFTPFQQAYFLKELADGCLTVAEGIINEHGLTTLLAEVRKTPEAAPLPAEKPKRPRRTRKPKTTP